MVSLAPTLVRVPLIGSGHALPFGQCSSTHRAGAGPVGIGDVGLTESLAGGVAMSEVVG